MVVDKPRPSWLKLVRQAWRIHARRRAVAAARIAADPCVLAHAVRHLADSYRDAAQLASAEQCYIEALKLYRAQERSRPLDLANAIRGFAVLKDATGETIESRQLWEEACSLYGSVDVAPGVAECAARLALGALDASDLARCRRWLAKADAAAQASADPETTRCVEAARRRIDRVGVDDWSDAT